MAVAVASRSSFSSAGQHGHNWPKAEKTLGARIERERWQLRAHARNDAVLLKDAVRVISSDAGCDRLADKRDAAGISCRVPASQTVALDMPLRTLLYILQEKVIQAHAYMSEEGSYMPCLQVGELSVAPSCALNRDLAERSAAPIRDVKDELLAAHAAALCAERHADARALAWRNDERAGRDAECANAH
jgi:hypothetical protein